MTASAETTSEPARRRILFVDDEVLLLEALQSVLRRMRRSWEMVFVNSGEAALEELARAPFDVLVSDMRMPRMDGAELLTHARDRFPGCARIILSGYAEPGALVRALPLAHQFLSKPCEMSSLKGAIERACSMRTLVEDDGLRVLLGKLDNLPSGPTIQAELCAVLENPESNSKLIARVVERDPAVCARLLQLVNSPYFGSPGEVDSIEDAVEKVGSTQLLGIARSAQVFPSFGDGARRLTDRHRLDTQHTGRIVRRLMPAGRQAEQAFSAALLHDVGQLVLLNAFPEQYRSLLNQAASRVATSQRSFAELEQELFGATHAKVGGYLLGMWGLPSAIVDAVAQHQQPQPGVTESSRLIAVLHAASAFVEARLEGLPASAARLDLRFLEEAKLLGELPAWQAVVEEELQECLPTPHAV